jgi:hypothetical protein
VSLRRTVGKKGRQDSGKQKSKQRSHGKKLHHCHAKKNAVTLLF